MQTVEKLSKLNVYQINNVQNKRFDSKFSYKRQSMMRLLALETIEILYSDALCNKNAYFDIQSYHIIYTYKRMSSKFFWKLEVPLSKILFFMAIREHSFTINKTYIRL